MVQNGKPLVSVCTTFRNADGYVHRLVESVLNQTYENVEIVLVDETSTDSSREVVEGYARRDRRVRYFRLDKKTGIAECLKKAFGLAAGRYIVFPGADDWLSRDFIEKGVKNFKEHPEAAGVVPKIITLEDLGDDKFRYDSEIDVPSGIYSRDWFVRELYRSTIGVASIMAMVRREDALGFMNDFMKNYCHNSAFPEELRKMYLRLFGTDMLFFLEILRRYENFVWDNSMLFWKIIQSQSITFDSLRRDSVAAILKYHYYHLICYAYAYKRGYPHFYPGMKIFVGLEAFATSFIYFLKSGFKSSFVNLSEVKDRLREFFADFSRWEIAAVATFLVPRIIYRSFGFVWRSISKKKISEKGLAKMFRAENFLNSKGYFQI